LLARLLVRILQIDVFANTDGNFIDFGDPIQKGLSYIRDGADTSQELIHCFFHRMGDLKTPKTSYLMGPSRKNDRYLEERKADLWDINKSLNLDQAKAADMFYVNKWIGNGLTAFAANHKKEYGSESGKFNWFRNSTGVPSLKSDNTAIEANFSSMKNVKRAPVMFVSRNNFLLTQSQDFCDKNYSFCSKGGLKDVFSGPKLNLPQDLDIASDTYNCPKSILVGGLLLNPTVDLNELEADEDKDFLLETLWPSNSPK
jgi:hypothetical protein